MFPKILQISVSHYVNLGIDCFLSHSSYRKVIVVARVPLKHGPQPISAAHN